LLEAMNTVPGSPNSLPVAALSDPKDRFITDTGPQMRRDIKAEPSGDGNPLVIPTIMLLLLATIVAFVSPHRETPSAIMRGDSPDDQSSYDSGAEKRRGRDAESPAEIPGRGWKDILWRTYTQIGEDRLLAVAAGVVFYGLLALFPAITALVSSYALFADPKSINDHLAFLADSLPAGTYSVVHDQIERVLAKGDAKLGVAFLASLLLAVWSANGGMKAIIDALNVVYDENEKRGFIKLNAVSLSFTLGSLLAVLMAIGLVVAAPIVLLQIGLGSLAETVLKFGRWPALAVMVLIGLAILYRFAPSRKSPKWKWISVGSVVGAAAWLTGSSLLSYYLANFGGYDATYGSLGAAIGLMIWMWMSTIIILFGAELNSEIEHQTAKDSTTGGNKPIGGRGAKMADTLGAPQ
jgi:membrane protein